MACEREGRLTDYEEIALLTGLLERNSPSEAEGPAAEYLVAQMSRLGFQAKVDEAGNAIGTIGSGAREVLLLGHIDTVDGHIPVRQEGDLLYGRGAVDAKGPLCAFVCAAARVSESIPPGSCRITVVGAVEEEAATSKGARHLLSRSATPAFVVIGEPSGWDRITLGYKGRLLVDYRLEREMSHTAGREGGACEELVGFWVRVRAFADAVNADRDRVFDRLDPSLRRVRSENDGLTESVVAMAAFRVPLDVDLNTLKAEVGALAAPATVKFYAEEVAFRAGKNTELARAFVTAIREAGGEPGYKVKTGTSDMNVVGPAWNCPIVAYGPGDSSLDHTPNEHISATEYARGIDVLARVLTALVCES